VVGVMPLFSVCVRISTFFFPSIRFSAQGRSLFFLTPFPGFSGISAAGKVSLERPIEFPQPSV